MSLLSIGCGGAASATASGSVKYGGKPVENGSIVFLAQDGTGGSAKTTIKGGSYTLGPESGLTEGAYRVQIYGYQNAGGAAAQPGAGAEGLDDPELAVVENAGPPIEGDPNAVSYIPSQYNLTTELTVGISAGENPNKDFDLKAATEKYR